MKTFSNATGRQWFINLTVGCLRRIKADLGVDLTAPEAAVDELGRPDASQSQTLIQRLLTDVSLFVDVLFAAIRPQAEEHVVTVEAFCEDLYPDHCRLAREAFIEELEHFFRLLGRDDRLSVVRAARELETEVALQRLASTERLTTAAISEVKSIIERETDKAIKELTSGTLSTNTPESPNKTPSR